MNLQYLINKGESKTLEFKENLPVNDSIAKTTIAFSNTSGGKLIIGINDQREIIGISNENIFDVQDKIASIIFDSCYPNIIPEIYTTNIEGKLLLVIEIFRGNLLPYYLKSEGKNNGTYIRIGTTNRRAGYENILELERQKRNISFDEEIDYDIELDSLDLEPLENEFKRVSKHLDIEKLLNLRLIKNENGKTFPTKALLILLGSYENTIIKCSRFKGETMDIFLDKKEYSRDLFSQLKNAENFILNHINIRAEINGLQRKDIPEIPVGALREALVNAFVHRDYSNMGRDIKLGVYDDIVNIVSPGAFPNTLLEEDLLNGRSEIRNKIIARVFKELGYIEQWGSGIKRIKSYCLDAGLKEPLIRERNDFVDVEFYRLSESIGKVSVIKAKTDNEVSVNIGKTTENEKLILKYIRDNQKIQSKTVEKILSLKEARARRILKEMCGKNLIERKGSGRNTYYILGN